jgi:hypothetical protein
MKMKMKMENEYEYEPMTLNYGTRHGTLLLLVKLSYMQLPYMQLSFEAVSPRITAFPLPAKYPTLTAFPR